MLYLKIGLTLELIGSILIAYTVIQVHYRFRKEHRVDERVFTIMQREQWVAILGILCLIAGYIFQFLTLA